MRPVEILASLQLHSRDHLSHQESGHPRKEHFRAAPIFPCRVVEQSCRQSSFNNQTRPFPASLFRSSFTRQHRLKASPSHDQSVRNRILIVPVLHHHTQPSSLRFPLIDKGLKRVRTGLTSLVIPNRVDWSALRLCRHSSHPSKRSWGAACSVSVMENETCPKWVITPMDSGSTNRYSFPN